MVTITKLLVVSVLFAYSASAIGQTPRDELAGVRINGEGGHAFVSLVSNDQNQWFLYIRRLFDGSEIQAGITVLGLVAVSTTNDVSPHGLLRAKMTRQGRSRSVVFDLVEDESLAQLGSVESADGETLHIRVGISLHPLSDSFIPDLVRGRSRMWTDTVSFEIDRRARTVLREIEDEILSDARFVQHCVDGGYSWRPFFSRVTNPARLPKETAQPTTSREIMPDIPDAPVTHLLETTDGRLLFGRLVQAGEESGIVTFVVCVGSVEQEMQFADDEVEQVTEAEK